MRSVRCIVLESDVVWSVMWCGERNFNRRCLSLHIGHDQIVIYIHSKQTQRSASSNGLRALSIQSTNFLSLEHPSVHKWIRRRYYGLNWICFVFSSLTVYHSLRHMSIFAERQKINWFECVRKNFRYACWIMERCLFLTTFRLLFLHSIGVMEPWIRWETERKHFIIL